MPPFFLNWKFFMHVAIATAEVATCMSKILPAELVAARENLISSVLWTTGQPPDAVLILVIDEQYQEDGSMVKSIGEMPHFEGMAIINVGGGVFYNDSSQWIGHFANEGRLHFQNTRILILSDDVSFLWGFAEDSLRNRLVARESKLIVHGNLTKEDVKMLTEHWIYSMMDGLIVIPSDDGQQERWDLLSCQVFTDSGKQLDRVGIWSQSEGIVFDGNHNLFPQKFSNFHGTTVNVTGLPYEPYWIEEKIDGSVVYSGTDRLMLEAMASTFNFSIRLVPVQDWAQSHDLVRKRSLWMIPIIHLMLPSRLELFDYTQTYEYDITLMFVMAKPVLEPKWQSLYYPLSYGVWMAILVALFVVSLGLFGIVNAHESDRKRGLFSYSYIVMEVFGMLIAQGSTGWHPSTSSVRVLLALWLLSAYIISSTYRGNLVASLVAPRYPPRPETVKELVKAVEKVTIPSWGQSFKDMLLGTGTESLTALGGMMEIGYEIDEGLSLALGCRYPYVDSVRYLQNRIALHYTEADGTTPFYIVREGLTTFASGWPIPHDAPYKENLDFVISALTESGIYGKWMNDWLDDAKRRGRRSKRLELERQYREDKQGRAQTKTNEDGDEPKALTFVHFQGPLLIWTIGFFVASIAFLSEHLYFYSITGKTI